MANTSAVMASFEVRSGSPKVLRGFAARPVPSCRCQGGCPISLLNSPIHCRQAPCLPCSGTLLLAWLPTGKLPAAAGGKGGFRCGQRVGYPHGRLRAHRRARCVLLSGFLCHDIRRISEPTCWRSSLASGESGWPSAFVNRASTRIVPCPTSATGCKTRQSSLFAKVDARDNATAALAMCQASALLRRHRLSFRDVVHQPEHAEQRL